MLERAFRREEETTLNPPAVTAAPMSISVVVTSYET